MTQEEVVHVPMAAWHLASRATPHEVIEQERISHQPVEEVVEVHIPMTEETPGRVIGT